MEIVGLPDICCALLGARDRTCLGGRSRTENAGAVEEGADIFTKTAVHYDQDGEAEDHALALIATGGAMPEVLYNVVCLPGLGWRFVLLCAFARMWRSVVWVVKLRVLEVTKPCVCSVFFFFNSSCRPS